MKSSSSGIYRRADHWNKLINSVWNKEELTDHWKESVIVPVYKKGDKTDYNSYPYIDWIAGNHQCEFRRNRSTTDHIFCIRQIKKKKKKLHGLSPRANYTDRATAASRRSVANLCG
jgi:hypothetical protein